MAQNPSNSLFGKNILLGITGGIAAYKSAILVRRLVESGANVRVVMTSAAKAFITPLTLQALSGHPVCDTLFDPAAEASMGHIELAKWAELIVIAPASANTIAKIAHGMADDLLTTLVLASKAPLALAPAMNQQMYSAKITQENLSALAKRGSSIWGPASGEQACGDIGAGRMLEPHEILKHIQTHFSDNSMQDLAGLSVLISAGPTREALDPARYISNHSSGKMGFAIAQAAAMRGAKVTLVSGPVSLNTPKGVARKDVESACEMHREVMEQAQRHDIFIACAAVADFRAKTITEQKIKKDPALNEISFTLVKNPDIVADVANLAQARPFTVGFAAETEKLAEHAKRKLVSKKLDLICANDVSSKHQGFNADENALHLYWPTGDKALAKTHKTKLATALLTEIFSLYQQSLKDKA